MVNKKKDFIKLTHQLKICKKCKDLPIDSHPVFAGKLKNKIMVIGQAPGKQELKHNLPFIGPAGKRLFKWLAGIGISEGEFRNAAYFTQIMKCYPGAGDRGDLRPNPKQLKNCASYLEQEIKLLNPKLVVPVGKLAIERILGKVKLEEVVGRKFFKELFGGKRTVIPLPHPSGASPWSFNQMNLSRITKAMRILKRYYVRLRS